MRVCACVYVRARMCAPVYALHSHGQETKDGPAMCSLCTGSLSMARTLTTAALALDSLASSQRGVGGSEAGLMVIGSEGGT